MQWALSFFVVLAVLFAPAWEEETAGPSRPADDSAEAWLLAPTLREGIVATGPKLSARHLQTADQRSRSEPVPVTLASVAAVLVLLSLTWSARRESRAASRLVAFRSRVPRGPPILQTA